MSAPNEISATNSAAAGGRAVPQGVTCSPENPLTTASFNIFYISQYSVAPLATYAAALLLLLLLLSAGDSGPPQGATCSPRTFVTSCPPSSWTCTS